MTKRTNHTVLVKVSSHGSGGRGEIVCGHRVLTATFTDSHLTSGYFIRFPIGTYVIVKVKLSGKRRLIQYVNQDEEVVNYSSFKTVYNDILNLEEAAFNKAHGISSDKSESVIITEEAPRISDPGTIEEWMDKIYVSREDRKLLGAIRKLSDKKHVAIMMIGPSGYGKTSIPQQMASEWGMNFLRWDCATVRDPEEFFGFRGAKDGSTMGDDGQTIFTESKFSEVVQKGNCVIVLDELNRIDPYISNILFPLLDHAGATSVAGHDIQIGPNVMFFATVNLGFQFTGTFTLDTALTNRFAAKVLVNALPKKIEEQILQARGGVDNYMAGQIVKLMGGLRRLNEKGQLSIDASTRVSIQLAELVGTGLDLKTALVYVVINGVSKEEAKLVIDQLGYIS